MDNRGDRRGFLSFVHPPSDDYLVASVSVLVGNQLAVQSVPAGLGRKNGWRILGGWILGGELGKILGLK